MRKLNKWLKQLGKKESKRARFDDALITNRAFGYTSYRLKYLSIRVILKASLHFAEMALFSRVFSMDFLAEIIILRSAILLAVSIWWGSLEQLRTGVRDHAKNKQLHLATKTIESWLSLSILFSTLTIGIGSAMVLSNTDERGFSIYNAYAIAVFIRFGLDVIGRTYHSGMFAIRRIFRPLWTLLLGDFLDVALVLALFPFWGDPILGVWSFSVSFLLVGILRFILLMTFVKKAYSNSALPPIKLPRLPIAILNINFKDLKGIVVHGLANGAAQIDTIFIMALTVAATNTSQMNLAIVLYILKPFISAGYSWSRLFYFDFKILQSRYSNFLRYRFLHLIKKVSIYFSLATGIVCAGWAWWFFGKSMGLAALALLPFMMVRSFFGLYQLISFSYGHYWHLFKMSLVGAGGALFISYLSLQPLITISLVSAVLLLVILLFPPKKTSDNIVFSEPKDRLVSLPLWLQLVLKIENMHSNIGIVVVNRKTASYSKVAQEFVVFFKSAVVARLGKNTFIWFSLKKISKANIIIATSGTASLIKMSGTINSVDDIKDVAATLESITTTPLNTKLLKLQRLSTKELQVEFTKRFKDGQIIDIKTGALPRNNSDINSVKVKEVLKSLVSDAHVNNAKGYNLGVFQMSVYVPCGRPEMLFLVNNIVEQRQRQKWIDNLYEQSLLNSMPPLKK